MMLISDIPCIKYSNKSNVLLDTTMTHFDILDLTKQRMNPQSPTHTLDSLYACSHRMFNPVICFHHAQEMQEKLS